MISKELSRLQEISREVERFKLSDPHPTSLDLWLREWERGGTVSRKEIRRACLSVLRREKRLREILSEIKPKEWSSFGPSLETQEVVMGLTRDEREKLFKDLENG